MLINKDYYNLYKESTTIFFLGVESYIFALKGVALRKMRDDVPPPSLSQFSPNFTSKIRYQMTYSYF